MWVVRKPTANNDKANVRLVRGQGLSLSEYSPRPDFLSQHPPVALVSLPVSPNSIPVSSSRHLFLLSCDHYFYSVYHTYYLSIIQPFLPGSLPAGARIRSRTAPSFLVEYSTTRSARSGRSKGPNFLFLIQTLVQLVHGTEAGSVSSVCMITGGAE